MPFLAAIPAIIGGVGAAASGIAGIAGATNTRPPSLSPEQSGTLNTLLPFLMQNLQQNTNTPAQIDPTQQNLMYGNIAQSLTGANNQATHALVSRGLGRSGILGDALIQNANTAQTSQNQANLGLQQQAIGLQQQNKQMDLSSLLSLLNVSNVPGQSPAGGFFAGMAPLLAYSIQNSANRKAANPGASAPNDSSMYS